MNLTILYTILSVVAISFVSFVGIFTLPLKEEKIKNITFLLVSLSAGTLLGDALIHLLPEAIEKLGNILSIWLMLLSGIIGFFVLEKIICWRHCHIPTTHDHPHPLGIMNLVGDGVHNFLDGLVIAGAFLVSAPIGMATTIAVIVHEIPQEISDFGVLLHAGYTRKKALILNFIIGLTALLGAGIGLIINQIYPNFASIILPFAAGGFIYIAAADLIPELKKNIEPKKSILELLFILIGIGAMVAFKVLGK